MWCLLFLIPVTVISIIDITIITTPWKYRGINFSTFISTTLLISNIIKCEFLKINFF